MYKEINKHALDRYPATGHETSFNNHLCTIKDQRNHNIDSYCNEIKSMLKPVNITDKYAIKTNLAKMITSYISITVIE